MNCNRETAQIIDVRTGSKVDLFFLINMDRKKWRYLTVSRKNMNLIFAVRQINDKFVISFSFYIIAA